MGKGIYQAGCKNIDDNGSKVQRLRGSGFTEKLNREFFLPTRQACEAGGNGEGMRIEQSSIQ
jgi:hypothetical protein